MAENKNLKFEDIWQYFLEANAQPTPKGFEPIRERGKKSTFLTPENMMALLNAISPSDLYMKPDYSPSDAVGYSTSAFDIDNRRYGNIGIPEAVVMASQEPKKLLPLYGMDTARKNYTDIPKWLQRFIPQGIYEHELGHTEDPRLVPEAKNYGYLMRNGLQGNIASREDVGMQAEDKFWDWIFENRDYVKEMIKNKSKKKK